MKLFTNSMYTIINQSLAPIVQCSVVAAAEEVAGLLPGLVDPDGVAARHQLVLAVLPLHGHALPLRLLGADQLGAGGAHQLANIVLHALLPHHVVGDGGSGVAVVLLHCGGDLGLLQGTVLPVNVLAVDVTGLDLLPGSGVHLPLAVAVAPTRLYTRLYCTNYSEWR